MSYSMDSTIHILFILVIKSFNGGFEKLPNKNEYDVVISTWQSLYKLPKSFFTEFQVIYGDEAHLFKAKSLTTILNKCDKSPFRIGTTGTLDGLKTHRLVLEGIFGPVLKVTTTKKLITDKTLADLKIFLNLLIWLTRQKICLLFYQLIMILMLLT